MGDIDENISQEEEISIATDEHDPDIHNGLDPETTDNLIVDKLDENQDVPMDIYKKMNITALKAVVTEKGYTHDAAKMKKNELLKLLETSA